MKYRLDKFYQWNDDADRLIEVKNADLPVEGFDTQTIHIAYNPEDGAVVACEFHEADVMDAIRPRADRKALQIAQVTIVTAGE